MTGTGQLRRVVVTATAGDHRRGLLAAGPLHAACALGRSGIRRDKREGDGATPAGHWRMVGLLYRADRLPRPMTRLPVSPIRPDLGWCDDPSDRRYNRPVRVPYHGSHERLWREDRLYDLLVVLDYNLAAPRPGAGSAVFLHLASPNFAPAAGCIAVAPETMRRILALVGTTTVIEVR